MEQQKSTLTWNVLSKYRGLLMGLGTLSVVFFHYTQDCSFTNHHYDGLLKLFSLYISSSGVELFLVLSGMGLYYAWKKSNKFGPFILKRYQRIFIPYILIGIPAYVIRDVYILDKGFLTALKGFSFYTLFTNGKTWHWYILMIAICYLIFPWIFELVEENKTKIQSHMVLLGAFAVTSVVALLLQEYYPLLFKNINIVILRFPAFILGAFLGRACYEKRPIGNDWIIFGILCIMCIPLRNTGKILLIRYAVGAIGLFAAMLCVKLFAWIDKHNINFRFIYEILEWCGKYSLEIYLTHVTVRSLMRNLGYDPCYFKHFIIEVVISVIWSVIVKKITDMLIGLLTKKKKTTA